MADVILTKNGKRFAFPADRAQEAMAAGFAVEQAKPPRPVRLTGSQDGIPAVDPAAPSHVAAQPTGSGRGISGAPPAGESDAADVILEKNGKRFTFPAANADAARAAGFADIESSGAKAKRILVYQPADFYNAVASDPAAAAAGFTKFGSFGFDDNAAGMGAGYGALFQALADGKPFAQAIGDAAAAIKEGKTARRAETNAAAARSPESYGAGAVGGTALTIPLGGAAARAVPLVGASKVAAAGAPLMESASLTASAAPTAAARIAAALPPAVAGSVGLGDAETLAGDARNAVMGAAAAPLAAILPAAADEAAALADDAVAKAAASGEKRAAENAARRIAQATKNAEDLAAQVASGKAPPSAAVGALDAIDAIVQHYDDLPEAARVGVNLGFSGAPGGVMAGLRAASKALRGLIVKAEPEAVAAVDDATQLATKTIALPSQPALESTVTDTVLGRAGRGAAPTAVARRGPLAAAAEEPSASMIEPPTITPTPQPKTVAPRERSRVPEATESLPPEPTQTRTTMTPQEPTETATASVRRAPAPTEGLDPTEVLDRAATEKPAEVAARARRRVSDDEARILVRDAAIEHGTTDLATLSSKTGLPSSQVGRMLPKLVENFRFRQQVAAAAKPIAAQTVDMVAEKAAPLAEASAPSSLARETVQDWGTRPASATSPLAAASQPRAFVPPDLLDAQVARTKDARRGLAAAHGQLAKEFKNMDPPKAVGRQRSAVGFDENSPGAAPIDTPKGRNRSSKGFEGPSQAPTTDRPPARQWRSMFEKMDAQGQRDFVAKLLETTPPERVRDKLRLDRKTWRELLASSEAQPVAATPSALSDAAATPAAAPLASASEPYRYKPTPEAKALSQSIMDGRRSARQQLRDFTPQRAFSIGEDAVRAVNGDPYADFAGLTDKTKAQSAIGAALLDDINGSLGLKGSKRVRTPQEAWAALIRKYPPETGETMAETIRNKIDSLSRAARMMRTIPGWEAFDLGSEIAALEATAKDLSHLENTGIRSLNLGDLPF